METKVCTKCGEEKSLDDFYRNKNTKDGRMSECKTCRRKYHCQRNFPIDTTKKNKVCGKCGEKKPIKEFNRDRNSSDGLCTWCRTCARKRWSERYSKKRYYLNRYGISTKEYSKMLRGQHGACLICGRTKHENGRGLNVDHDHETGEVRGLLCTRCNFLVGVFENNLDVCLKILEYIGLYEEN